VPADLRPLEVHQLSCDEPSLTGESMPVSKQSQPLQEDTPLADRTNMAYAGTFVTRGPGPGYAVVVIGQSTELGQISSDLEQQVNLSMLLTRRFARFSRLLLKVVAVAAVLIFLVGVSRAASPGGRLGDVALTLARQQHHPCDRRAPDGTALRHHPQTAGCRGPRQRHGDLLRQNRHPHGKPHDRGDTARRRGSHRRAEWWRPPEQRSAPNA